MIDKLRTHTHLVLPIAIALGAFCVHRDVLHAPLLGFDAYAAIIASRVQSFSDLMGTFTEVMMDGRLWAGDFYRPMGNLLLAGDYAIWGLDTVGYQLTNMLVWCVTIATLYALTRKLLGGSAWLGPAFASVFFALHPATLSILPYPARRTETLMLLFVALALLALPTRAGESVRRRGMLAGMLALGAAMSKETGVVAVPLIFLHQLVYGEAATPARRAVDSTLAALPAALLSLAFVIVRFVVIGGMGGYHIGSDAPFATKIMMFGPQYLTATLASGDFDVPGSRGPIALLICGGITAAALLLVRRGGEPTDPTAPRTLQTLCVAGCWFAGSLLLACLSMQFSPRYVMPLSFAVGMLLGALLEGARFELREGASASRAMALGAVAVIAVSAFVALNGTALETPYHELRQATRTQRQLLGALSHRIERAADFEYIHLDLQRKVPVEARAVDDLWMIAPWGLEAWLELTHPDRPYTVSKTTRRGVPTAEYWSVTLNPKRSEGSEQGDG